MRINEVSNYQISDKALHIAYGVGLVATSSQVYMLHPFDQIRHSLKTGALKLVKVTRDGIKQAIVVTVKEEEKLSKRALRTQRQVGIVYDHRLRNLLTKS
jgi:hypothetical protein